MFLSHLRKTKAQFMNYQTIKFTYISKLQKGNGLIMGACLVVHMTLTYSYTGLTIVSSHIKICDT